MQQFIPSVFRAIEVFNLLSTPMTTDEVVAHSQIPKTTVQRILNTLQKAGYITRNDKNHTFLASMELIPRESVHESFERLLDASLARLAWRS